MRKVLAVVFVAVAVSVASPVLAQEGPKPEAVVEKMAFKFVRGITNVATSVVELPKQSYLMARDRGAIGFVVGPLKGLGMTVYRALIGTVETTLFLVPQPGYYDPMIDPEFVWHGWEERRNEPLKQPMGDIQEPSAEKKGE